MTGTAFDFEIPVGEPTMGFRRFIKAPPRIVFEAFTDPRHLPRWWGPRGLELVVCEVDLRVGGGYRFVHRTPDGREFAFRGEYREIDPPRLLVNTFVWEGAPQHESVETTVFEAAEGGTLVIARSVHDSVEGRDMHLANGMERGMIETFERLDEHLDAEQAAR
jgi:uncharacterized protein YndB with AHSA1/START domain